MRYSLVTAAALIFANSLSLSRAFVIVEIDVFRIALIRPMQYPQGPLDVGIAGD